MFILKICSILLSIGIFFLVFLKINKQKEYFDEDKTKSKAVKSDSISNLLKNAKNEINANKEEWLIYNAAKDKDNYVLTLYKSIEPVYTIKISKSNNGETLYTVNGADNKTSGTNGIQEDEGTPSSYGRFESSMVKINYKRNSERITINIGTGKIVIIGYGGFANDNSYPHPWSQVMPIVYKEGGSVIAIMDYSGNKKDVKSKTTYLPMEIIVSKKNKKYLPLFFKVYVLLQKYILSLQ